MKKLIFVLLFAGSQMMGLDLNGVRLVHVIDGTNESITGAKVSIIGTTHVFYTNIKGDCYIPEVLLLKHKELMVEFVSYKTLTLNSNENSTKVILEKR